jgi:hypothetical protein
MAPGARYALEWPNPNDTYYFAIDPGDLDAIKWVHAHGCPLEPTPEGKPFDERCAR